VSIGQPQPALADGLAISAQASTAADRKDGRDECFNMTISLMYSVTVALATLRNHKRSAANDSMPVQEIPPGSLTVSLEYMARRLSIRSYPGTNRLHRAARGFGARRARGQDCPDPLGTALNRLLKNAHPERFDLSHPCGSPLRGQLR
jgi:hypothetical protein